VSEGGVFRQTLERVAKKKREAHEGREGWFRKGQECAPGGEKVQQGNPREGMGKHRSSNEN